MDPSNSKHYNLLEWQLMKEEMMDNREEEYMMKIIKRHNKKLATLVDKGIEEWWLIEVVKKDINDCLLASLLKVQYT